MNEPRAASRRMEFETAAVAGFLAEFLDRVLPITDRTSDGREFLRSAALMASERPSLSEAQPFDRLIAALALSPLEINLCLLAGMPEQHEGYAAVFRALHPRGESRPTAGLAAQLFCQDTGDRFDFRALLESGNAVAGGALRLRGEHPFFERTLELAEGLWPVLEGIDAWPAGMPRLMEPIVQAGLEEWLAAPPALRAVSAIAGWQPVTVLVTGESEDTAFHRALALVANAGCEPAGFAPPPQLDVAMEQLIRVHALARGVVPVLRIAASEGSPGNDAPRFQDYPGPVVLCARAGGIQVRGPRPLIGVTADRLSAAARCRMWSAALPSLAEESGYLAARFPLEPAGAAVAAADLQALRSFAQRPVTIQDAATVIRARAGLSLAGGVKLITPTATWDDLILPPDRLAQLREASARLRLQDRVLDDWGFLKGRTGARGVRMLFAGPPGTGKTLSAEVLAHSLSVDLLYVDISRVVSKWIGETEKNLASVFETAERAQAVLLFDEADALFGKRTEVSDAHDRYANLETAYLLSRLERFEGMAILTTNLRQNIDSAFIRRLEFAIDFDAPDRGERLALWQVHVPPDAPVASDVDLREFATAYPVVGAFIRNAATAAAFLAAGNGGVINRSHFIQALRREYEKAGQAFPGAAGLGKF